MLIRPYSSLDREAVLTLFHLNCPEAFAESELDDLLVYLDKHLEYYFVLEIDGKIVACGGINTTEDPKHFKISWDMVHPEYHGRGFGRKLLDYRLDFICEKQGGNQVTVRTSQIAWRFYAKAGFILKESIPDYWAEGFDLYRMELLLSP